MALWKRILLYIISLVLVVLAEFLAVAIITGLYFTDAPEGTSYGFVGDILIGYGLILTPIVITIFVVSKIISKVGNKSFRNVFIKHLLFGSVLVGLWFFYLKNENFIKYFIDVWKWVITFVVLLFIILGAVGLTVRLYLKDQKKLNSQQSNNSINP